MQRPDVENRPYHVREEGQKVVLTDQHGVELSFAPADALQVSNALLQAAISAEGGKAWRHR